MTDRPTTHELETRVRAFLGDVDSGKVRLTMTNAEGGLPPQDDYPLYESGGWKICVFNDAGEWDYIEWVETPEGDRLDYMDSLVLQEYHQPADYSAWGYDG